MIVQGIIIKLKDDGKYQDQHNGMVQVRIPNLHGPLQLTDYPANYHKTESKFTKDEYLPWAFVVLPLEKKIEDIPDLLEFHEVVYIYTEDEFRHLFVIGTRGFVVEEGSGVINY